MIDVEVLYQAARETIDLLPRVRALIPVQGTVAESQLGSQRRVSAAPIPWHSPAAFTALGIGDDARRHEAGLTLRLFHRATYRPGTDGQVAECVSRLPVLVAHAREALGDLDQDDVEHIARDIARWPRDCRRVLDELRADEQPWTRSPGGLVCPQCEAPLWLRPGWATHPEDEPLWCRRCTDDDGIHLSWAPSIWTGLVLTADPPTAADGEARLVTAVQAAEVLPRVEASTVRQWASRGHVRAVAATTTGAKLYRLADLRERAGVAQ